MFQVTGGANTNNTNNNASRELVTKMQTMVTDLEALVNDIKEYSDQLPKRSRKPKQPVRSDTKEPGRSEAGESVEV